MSTVLVGSAFGCKTLDMQNHALSFVVLAVAGFLNRRQQAALEYLVEENRILREQLSGRRLRFTDAQRRRLAMKGRALAGAPPLRTDSTRANHCRADDQVRLTTPDRAALHFPIAPTWPATPAEGVAPSTAIVRAEW
ncbi:MAG: hypothetical protein DRJ42_27750, partial [Deltaproteobacteria bacterium]